MGINRQGAKPRTSSHEVMPGVANDESDIVRPREVDTYDILSTPTRVEGGKQKYLPALMCSGVLAMIT